MWSHKDKDLKTLFKIMILGLNMVVTKPKMIRRSILVLPAQIRSKTLGTPQNIVGCSA